MLTDLFPQATHLRKVSKGTDSSEVDVRDKGSHRFISASRLCLTVAAFALRGCLPRRAMMKNTTCLLAPPTLEAFRLCFLFPGAERFEQVFFFNFLVGSTPLRGHHFLVRMSV